MEWIRNRTRNEEIRKLRRDGFSIRRISELLGVSKSTVSLHCKHITSDIISQQELLLESRKRSNRALSDASLSNQRKWDQKKAEVRALATIDWYTIRQNPNMMGFLGLYWGEGSKANHEVAIVNNDPGIIVAAIGCFRQLCPGAKLRILIRVYPDHDKREAESFWSSILRTDVRVIDKQWAGKLHRAHSRRGLCTVRFSDWKTKIKIMTWIDLWRKELIKSTDASPG